MIDIEAVLAGTEGTEVEVKLAAGGLPDSLWETYSAFANTFGGVILLGVLEEKTTHRLIPQGVKDPHSMISAFWNTIGNQNKVNSNVLVNDNVYALNYNGMDIVVIEVPRADRRDKPIYIGRDMFKGTFKRNYEGNYRCRREEVLAMLRDQSPESVDGKVIEALAISDLNAESIQHYRAIFRSRKPGHVWADLGDTEFLMRIGAAKKGEDREVHPTLAGLLFFGDYTTIIDEVPDFLLDYRERLSTDTRWSDRVCSNDGNWSGNVFDFYFRIIDRLTADVKRPFKLDASLLRVDDTPIHVSLREALANALIHADYYGQCGIVVDKEFRKITISNPGTFRISIDAAIAGGLSDARNSRIFTMFSLISVGERAGSGLCDLYSNWKKCGYKTPELCETVNPDRVSLTLEIEIEHKGETLLTNSEAKVLAVLRANNSASASQVARETGLSVSTITRAYKGLKSKGYIVREGNNTLGKWIILK